MKAKALFEYQDNELDLALGSVQYWNHPLHRPAAAVDLCAIHLHTVATKFPQRLMADALRLMTDRRPYVFERNLQRWPDGRFWLVNRSYEHWCRLHISFSVDELEDLGMSRWINSRGVSVGFMEQAMPLADDMLWNRPSRWKLENLAGLMQAIYRHMAKRIVEETDGKG